MELAPRTVQKHAGLFAAGTDDRFASGFDDAGADEQVLRAEFRVSHAFGILVKVVGFGTDLFEQLRIGRYYGSERGHEVFDLAFVQQILW